MSTRIVHRMAGLASAAALVTAMGVASPTAALALPRPDGAPAHCALGSYCIFLNSNFTGVDAEGNAKVTNQPLGATITAVENDTPWTVVLQYGRTSRVFASNTASYGFSFYATSYTVH